MMSTASSSDQKDAGLSDIGKSSSNTNSNNTGDDSKMIINWKERIDIYQ